MKKIFLAILFLISFSVVIAQFTPPSGYTTYYRFRMWNQSASPGADSLNKNSIDIDKAIHDRQLSIDTIKNITLPTSYWSKIALDTSKYLNRKDTIRYFTKYNLDTSAIPYKSDTLHYFTTYNFDTLKNFYRRDTIKYYSVYNLDTASKMTYAKDSSHLAHTDTLTSEDIKGKWTFWNIIRFVGIVTFDVSPVFNSAVNFASGITTTTLTASGTATFNGDLVPAGWIKNQSSDHELQYTKEKIFKFKAPAVNGTTNIAHGLDWHNICEYGAVIKDDTLNFSQQAGHYFTNGYYLRLESLNVVVILQSTAYQLANDSGYAWVRYLDPNR